MKKGTVAQAPYGKVRITGTGKNGFTCVYLDGVFAGRDARIESKNLKPLQEDSTKEAAR